MMRAGILGTSNQLLGMNAAGNENEYKTLNGSINILVSLTHWKHKPHNLTGYSPCGFTNICRIKVSSLAINSGVYTDAFSFLNHHTTCQMVSLDTGAVLGIFFHLQPQVMP